MESSPRNTFDAAALAAVKHASFSTTELADPKKPQRARFRINFTLADSGRPGAGPEPGAAAGRQGGAARHQWQWASGPRPILSPKPTQPLQVNYPEGGPGA